MNRNHPKILFVGSFTEGQVKASFGEPQLHDNAHSRMIGRGAVKPDRSDNRYYEPVVARNLQTAHMRLQHESFDAIVMEHKVNDLPGDYGKLVRAQPRGEELLGALRRGDLSGRNQHIPIVYMQSNLYNGAHLAELDDVETVIATDYYDHMDEDRKQSTVFDRVKQALEKLLPEQGKGAYVGV